MIIQTFTKTLINIRIEREEKQSRYYSQAKKFSHIKFIEEHFIVTRKQYKMEYCSVIPSFRNAKQHERVFTHTFIKRHFSKETMKRSWKKKINGNFDLYFPSLQRAAHICRLLYVLTFANYFIIAKTSILLLLLLLYKVISSWKSQNYSYPI